MIEYGVAGENIRKLISKDDSANSTNKTDGVLDTKMAKTFGEQILRDHGAYAPYDMKGAFEYRITLPKAEKIMKAQSSESVEGYRLNDMHLEYETIESEELARRVNAGFEVGRSHNYMTLLKSLPWSKNSQREVIPINIPRKSTKGVVLLFTRADARDSEEYFFAKLENVSVTIEGNPNAVYTNRLSMEKMYDEARRFFGTMSDKCNNNLMAREFCNNNFALVIDLRTVGDNTVVGSGRRLVGIQSGILLEITKAAMTHDPLCHVFIVANGLINIVNRTLQGIEC